MPREKSFAIISANKSRLAAGGTAAEPTASTTGGLARDALSGFTPRTGAEIAALFMADRVAHNVNPINGIGKLLSEGRVVLCDRYYYSSLAYQGTVTDPEWVFRINIDCPEIRKPDLCVFLDLDDEECLRRMEQGRSYREIYENENSLLAVRRRYYEIFRRLEHRDLHRERCPHARGGRRGRAFRRKIRAGLIFCIDKAAYPVI